MELSYDYIRRNVLELMSEYAYNRPHINDWADDYGEPGYGFPYGVTTPMVLVGDFWCRCDDPRFIDQETGKKNLHDMSAHHPRVWAQLESQGVECQWCDEWVVVWEDCSRAYRTQPDSYSWLPSAILDGESCEWLTIRDDAATWIEWAENQETRAIPSNVMRKVDGLREEIETRGYVDAGEQYAFGWYGHEDRPEKIAEKIRARGDDFLFIIDGTGQFETQFSVMVRTRRHPISSNRYSVDGQAMDSVAWLKHNRPDDHARLLAAFPEIERVSFDLNSSWFDVEAMGVDQEWGSWLVDWIEQETDVQWEDGEPYAPEQ